MKENNQSIKIWFYLIILICLIILGLIIQPKEKYSYKPKAASVNGVDLIFDGPNAVASTAGIEYILKVKKNSSRKIAVARIEIEYPNNILEGNPSDLIAYQTPFQKSTLGQDGFSGTNRIIVFAEGARGTDGNLLTQSDYIAFIKLKVKNGVTNGTSGNFAFKVAEIVGETGSLTVEQHNPLTLTVGPSPTASQTTQTPGENITVNLKLKFQGVLKKPSGSLNSLQVKVRAVGGGKDETKTAQFTADDNGIWSGSVTFTTLTPGSNFKIYTKGPKHLRKKICSSSPLETYPGTYHCEDGQITLNSGQNTLNFSSVYQLVGDLPGQEGIQDGIVNSYDTSLVTINLNKNDAQAVGWADLNLDGVVNAQDYSLIIAALSIRTDE